MPNSTLPADPSCTPNAKTQKISEIRQKDIASMIAGGFTIKDIAKKLKISESRIYHLRCDKNSLVNAEISRIRNEASAASDRSLINLFDKALQKLDAMLSSPDEEKQCRAIDRIIKMYSARSSKNDVSIQQYFGPPETMDDIIRRKQEERGLPRDY